jgi:hypothetical protein
VSYTQVDRTWAEWVAWALEAAGYTVLIQAWDFVPGSNWVTGMNEGVSRAARTVAVLSDAYAGSVYGRAEWQAAWAADPDGAARKLLVVRVEDCTRPGLLDQMISIDLFGKSEDQARVKLVGAARLAVSGGRSKPPTAPAFPGGARAVPAPPAFPGHVTTAGPDDDAPAAAGSIQIGNVSAPGGQAIGINHGQMTQHQATPARTAAGTASNRRLPRVVPATFGVYEELRDVFDYFADQFRKDLPALREAGFIGSADASPGRILVRVEHQGRVAYAIDIVRGGQGSGDDRITFAFGHHNGLGGGYNAWATPFFDRQAQRAKLKYTDFSSIGSGDSMECELTREELFDALWDRIVEALEHQRY